MIKISSDGVYDPTCLFNGLVAWEKLSNDYRQSDTLCQNHDGIKYPSRSFYCHNSSLSLVLYWYKPYSTINVTVNISQTKCQPVPIKFCHYDHTFDCKADSKCHSYLNYVTKYSPINISLSGGLTFTQLHGKCIIVTLFSNGTSNLLKCEINIELKMSLAKAIKGLIQGQPLFNHVVLEGLSTKITTKDFFIKGKTYAKGKRYFYFDTTVNSILDFHIGKITARILNYHKCWIEIVLLHSNWQNFTAFYSKVGFPNGPMNVYVHKQISSKHPVILMEIHGPTDHVTKRSSLYSSIELCTPLSRCTEDPFKQCKLI